MVQEREINIASILHVMWERGKKITIFTFSAMLIGAIVTLFIHNRYEAESTLFVNVSKLGIHMINKDNTKLGDAYWQMISSKGLMLELIREYGLDKRPYKFKYAQDLRKRIEIGPLEEGLPVFYVKAELEDATKAAAVANRLASEAISITDRLREEEKESSVGRIEDELKQFNITVNGYRENYLEKLNENLKPMVINHLSVLYSNLARNEQELENLNHSIVELEKRESGYAELFSATDFTKFVITRRSVVDDPLLLEKLKGEEPRMEFDNLGNFTLFSEDLSGPYLSMEMEYRKLKIDLPTMRTRRDFAIERIAALTEEIKQKQQQLNIMDTEEMIAKADFDRSLEVMSGIDKQVGWAGTTVTTERLDVFVVHEAIPDMKKVYPQRSLMVVLVGMMAFLISLMYYLITDLYGLVLTGIVTAPAPVSAPAAGGKTK